MMYSVTPSPAPPPPLPYCSVSPWIADSASVCVCVVDSSKFVLWKPLLTAFIQKTGRPEIVRNSFFVLVGTVDESCFI